MQSQLLAPKCRRTGSPIPSYADISPAAGQHFIFALEKTVEVPRGYVGFSLVQRKWAMVSINQELEVRPYRFDASSDVITCVSFETDFLQKKT